MSPKTRSCITATRWPPPPRPALKILAASITSISWRAARWNKEKLTVPTALEQLREILAEVSDINRAASVLGWDQETYMPPGGVKARANQLSTLRRLSHTRFTADEVGRLLDQAAAETAERD